MTKTETPAKTADLRDLIPTNVQAEADRRRADLITQTARTARLLREAGTAEVTVRAQAAEDLLGWLRAAARSAVEHPDIVARAPWMRGAGGPVQQRALAVLLMEIDVILAEALSTTE